MSSRIIFISCGQFTREEKALGKAIVKLVDAVPGLQAYFAEEVHDLNGLDSNILSKLHECDAFITVLHPRGTIRTPDGSVLTRASVWIEQEIAIATYIRQIEKRLLRVIAFRHKSVSLEGIRTLVHLNPIEFTDEDQVIRALPRLLEQWKSLPATGIRPQIKATTTLRHDNGHAIRQLAFIVENDSNARITEISGRFRIPRGVLKHWSHMYALLEEPSSDQTYRIFRFNDKNVRPIEPHSSIAMFTYDYCIECAIEDTQQDQLIAKAFVSGYEVELTVWINGREYSIVRTMKDLQMEAAGEV